MIKVKIVYVKWKMMKGYIISQAGIEFNLKFKHHSAHALLNCGD